MDAADFAVVKIDAEPAKNPSVWISRTEINFTNAKTGDFWLPEQNRSETKVRIGGTAVLTIVYGPYQVDPEAIASAAGAASLGRAWFCIALLLDRNLAHYDPRNQARKT